jgi:hypothetical protein
MSPSGLALQFAFLNLPFFQASIWQYSASENYGWMSRRRAKTAIG